MGFALLIQNTRELWKEWEMRLLVLLSLFLQWTLATQASRRKYNRRKCILIVVWMSYILADSIASLTLGIFPNHLANSKDTKGTIDPKSQITAFWASFLLLHLGGPDTITAFVQEDNELWLRQFVRLCVQVGLVGYIYYIALLSSTLSMLAAGMILVGLMKYVEKILCLYLASKGRLRDSMFAIPDFIPMYPSIIQRCVMKKEEGYHVEIHEIRDVPAPLKFQETSSQMEEDDLSLVRAYDLFKVFKLLFLGLIGNSSELEASKQMFKGLPYSMAFKIVEIELALMYDLLYTKAPLLNSAWGIIRWVISLSVPCASFVFFSLQDKKDYARVDVWITFLLISGAILLEIYSLLPAVSSDWIDHWRLQRTGRSKIASAMATLRFCPNQRRTQYITKKKRWTQSVAQFSLMGLSIRKRNRIFLKHPWLAKLDEKSLIFHVDYKKVNASVKKWIFDYMNHKVADQEGKSGLKPTWEHYKLEAKEVLLRSNFPGLTWSVEEREFDQSILIWHIATELCYYRDRKLTPDQNNKNSLPSKISKWISRYMLYLMLLQPSMLPTGIGVLRYRDTSIEVQNFLEENLAVTSKGKNRVNLSAVKSWALNLFKKAIHVHTDDSGCGKSHKSANSRDICEVCHGHILHYWGRRQSIDKIGRGKSRSVLFEACYLAYKLDGVIQKWDLIAEVWAKLLIFAAYQCKGNEHCERLSRGGELLSHIWLLMAHFGIADAVQTSEPQCGVKLIKS